MNSQYFFTASYTVTNPVIPGYYGYGFQPLTQNFSMFQNTYTQSNKLFYSPPPPPPLHTPPPLSPQSPLPPLSQQYTDMHNKNQSNIVQNFSVTVNQHKKKYCRKIYFGECLDKSWNDAREVIMYRRHHRSRHRHHHIDVKCPVINTSIDRQTKIKEDLKLLKLKQKCLLKELASMSVDKKNKV